MTKTTEDVNPRFSGFETWSTRDGLDAIFEGQLTAVSAIRAALGDMTQAVDRMAERIGKTGRLIYVGAGTSGRLAVMDGVELGPTFGWPGERLSYCLAGGDGALLRSAEGAEDDVEDGRDQIRRLQLGAQDIVIGVAASGRTPFTVSALEEANRCGALTVGVANNGPSALLDVAACPILVETGSEVLAGSTRMKAGTAQKAVLNMLSTALMVRLGRVYKGYMVDMVVSNAKLADRAVRIVSEITGVDRATAAQALALTANRIKPAVLVALGESPEHSCLLLDQADGNLRDALVLRAQEKDAV